MLLGRQKACRVINVCSFVALAWAKLNEVKNFPVTQSMEISWLRAAVGVVINTPGWRKGASNPPEKVSDAQREKRSLNE